MTDEDDGGKKEMCDGENRRRVTDRSNVGEICWNHREKQSTAKVISCEHVRKIISYDYLGYGSELLLARYYDTYLPFLFEACNDKSIDVEQCKPLIGVSPPLPALSWLKLQLHSLAFDVPLQMMKLWTIYLVCR
ncbi:hypothetical protein Scep_016652 [Stephania cephalantha]|uniref:Uncharacterized protein n=1 Tax=Stephania cephalantha TaxID=152367 RepID=A0AAP0IN02_9MAGN